MASEERDGQQQLQSIDNGARKCADLSDSDFERVGEYVMGRMAGSVRAHERMNQLMSDMMGSRGEEQMHEFMGRRFTRCGGGRLPGGLARMMGGIGMMGGSGMMGAGRTDAQLNGYGGMMGRWSSNDEDDDWSSAAIVMSVLMVALLGAVAVLAFRGPLRQKRSRSALDILDERYARGEIESDDYEQRRRALGGGS